jgi:peroxiredoxin
MKTALLIAFLALSAAFSIKVKNDLRHEKSPLEAIQIGQTLPDFTLPNPAGTDVTLSQSLAQNKIVVINFWASWCAPCRIEMPSFEKMYQSKKDRGLLILAVNEDEERAKMDEYLQQKPVSFPVLVDRNSELMKQFGVQALPTTIVVGEDGKVQMVYQGLQEYMEFLIDPKLKPMPAK